MKNDKHWAEDESNRTMYALAFTLGQEAARKGVPIRDVPYDHADYLILGWTEGHKWEKIL